MPERRWRWVYLGGRHHLARETCNGKWVKVCEALQVFPFATTPERYTLKDGTAIYALKNKVAEHEHYWAGALRVTLDRRKEAVCSECREHAKEIAALWRGLNRKKKPPQNEQERGA